MIVFRDAIYCCLSKTELRVIWTLGQFETGPREETRPECVCELEPQPGRDERAGSGQVCV